MSPRVSLRRLEDLPNGRRRVHWGLLGVALVPLSVVAAELDLPDFVVAALGMGGVVLVLLALEVPQRFVRWLSDGFGHYLQQTLDDHRGLEARRLCGEAAATVHSLFASEHHPRISRQRARQILTTYEQVHRAAVVHAVEAGIGASATDAGTLGLAKHPKDIADLHALQAGLLRMVVELGQRLGPAPEPMAYGSNRA